MNARGCIHTPRKNFSLASTPRLTTQIFQLLLEAKKKSYTLVQLVFVFFLPFDLIKAGATQTETLLLIIKQHAAGVRVDLLDNQDIVQEYDDQLS